MRTDFKQLRLYLQISCDPIAGEPLLRGTTEGDGGTSQDYSWRYPFVTSCH